MSKIWDTFTEIHGGTYLARDAFEEFCSEILKKHYPGKAVVLNKDYKEKTEKKINVIYESKYFTDKLDDSRKGQIRKSFKDFVNRKNKIKQKVFVWVLCIPYVLNDDEMKWWVSWNEKMRDKYSVNIEIFDSDHCIELAKKYDLYNKWFKNVTEQNNDEKDENLIKKENKNIENENSVTFELLDTGKKIQKTEEKEKKKAPSAPKKEKKEQEIEKTRKTEKKPEKETIKLDADKDKKFKFAQKLSDNFFKYNYFLKEFKRIKKVADNLKDEDQKKLKKINSHKNWRQLFKKVDTENLDTLKLFYKAKSNEVHKNFPIATFIYEKILKKHDYKTLLRFKIDDLEKSLKKCQDQTQALLYELEGDLHFVRENSPKSVAFYEKAYKIYRKLDRNILRNEKSKNVAKKYFETLAKNQLKNDLPEKAVQNFEKALKYDKSDQELSRKKNYAKYLAKGKKFFNIVILKPFNIFLSPLAYNKALKYEKDKSTKEKFNRSIRRFYYAISFVAILIIVAFFTIKFALLPTEKQNKKNIVQTTNSLNYDVLKPLSPAEVAVFEGNQILENITYHNIHLIDTAIAAYKRALNYNSKKISVNGKKVVYTPNIKSKIDTLAYKKFNKAKKYRKSYISNVQSNILKDSAQYFIGMRRFSEGLKLFKYIYDPSNPQKGKYGFVDSSMNIIIPPFYDFNYKRMFSGTENFNNGIALVCLISSDKDTNYFYIDTKNRRVNKRKWAN